MLGKLLKYEIKATARLFLPLYLAILIFGLINKVFNLFDAFRNSVGFSLQAILGVISVVIYFSLIIGIVVMTLVIMIQRFYKNLLGDEGYLMFTLPVKPWKHIISKLLVAMLWTILSFLTVICSILIIMNAENILEELSTMIHFFRDSFGYAGFFIMPTFALLATALNIAMIYAAITLGHLFSKHKLLASFGMYSILYIIYQIVLVLFILLFRNSILASILTSSAPTPFELNMFLLSLSFISIVLISGNFILTNIILKKKLNLE